MKTITFTKTNGERGSKVVADGLAETFVASFVRYGYTNVSVEAEAAAAVAEVTEVATATAAVRTGRTQTGKVVHRLSLNSAECGASFRRNRLGNAVKVTGEAVTCLNCLKLG